MNLADLKSQVESWVLDLPDSTEALITQWINHAIKKAEERHNFFYMQAEAAFTTSEATRKLGDAPARYKEDRSDPYLLGDDGSTLEIDWATSESDMIRQYGNDSELDAGEPAFLLRVYDALSGNEEFDCYPLPDGKSDYDDGEYRIRIPYWRYTAALSADGDSNWLSNNAEQYVIYKAASIGMIFNRDETRGLSFDKLAEREFLDAKRLDKRRMIPSNFNLNPNRNVHRARKLPRRRGGLNNGRLP